jgi:hypothetical protein
VIGRPADEVAPADGTGPQRSNGDPRRSLNGTEFAPKHLPRPAGGRTRFPRRARPSRPSEPILIPKLRIQFADFPYLHYSIDQRLLTSETCCGYGYELVRVRRNLPGIFKVPPGARGRRENCGALGLDNQNPFSLREDSRASVAYAEKTTLPRAPAGVSQSCRVAATDTRVRTVPLPGSGIWTGFPFGFESAIYIEIYSAERLIKASPKP